MCAGLGGGEGDLGGAAGGGSEGAAGGGAVSGDGVVWAVAVMAERVAGVAAVLVIWTGRVAVVPSWTEPKLSEKGVTVMGDGVAMPRREMNSRAVLESEVISRAEMRLVVVLVATGCGEKAMMMVQLAEGTSVAQLVGR